MASFLLVSLQQIHLPQQMADEGECEVMLYVCAYVQVCVCVCVRACKRFLIITCPRSGGQQSHSVTAATTTTENLPTKPLSSMIGQHVVSGAKASGTLWYAHAAVSAPVHRVHVRHTLSVTCRCTLFQAFNRTLKRRRMDPIGPPPSRCCCVVGGGACLRQPTWRPQTR